MTSITRSDAGAPGELGGLGGLAARPSHPLWRLEWWRLVRTHRIVALVGVHAFFGATAAPLTRYMGDLVERFGGGVQVIVPAARPVDGFVNYVSNANQLGLLVIVMIAATALTVDAQHEMAIFIRTRVARPRDLVLPRYAVNVAAASGAFTIGVLCTWYGTVLLLGDVDTAGVLVGTALQLVYLAFITSVTAVLGSRLHSTMTTAAATIAVALLLALVGALDAVGVWLPSHLLGSLSTLPAGGSVADFARSLAVTVGATAVLLGLAVRLAADRET